MKKYVVVLLANLITSSFLPVLANNPPGPMVILPEIILLPAMILFSLLGGAYIVLNQLHPSNPAGWSIFGCVIAVLVSFTHETLGAAATVTFGIMALIRGIQMIRWGLPFGNALNHGVPSWRMVPCGIALSITAVYLTGMSLAFVFYWPEYWNKDDEYLVQFLTYQLAFARCHKEKTGVIQFQHTEDQDDVWQFLERDQTKPATFRIEFAEDNRSFAVLVLPRKLPFFPYNLLVSQPSFRADGSGKIRMSLVHSTSDKCPSDAPVVYVIPESDVAAMMDRCKNASDSYPCLSWANGCQGSSGQAPAVNDPDKFDFKTLSEQLARKWERRKRWLRGDPHW